ncbi:MAG TPA: HlyD family efflux transporter periplasmic adaptor subunit [Candidatus Baltobacteraceae bacterium]|jgi:HlyD family secretion protein
MDVARERRRAIPKSLYALAAIALLVGLTLWAVNSLSKAGSAGTAVDKSTLVTDVVRRGTFVRSVTAQGVFAPERVRVVSAAQSGVVEQVLLKAGTFVESGSVIARMENPQIEAAVTQEQAALQVAQANLASAKQQARAAVLTAQTAFADTQAQMQQDHLQAESFASLHRQGLISTVDYQKAAIEAAKSSNDLRDSRIQIGVSAADAQAKVAAAQAQVEQTAAVLAAEGAQVASLTVRAASSGIVQSVDVDPGASIAQNTEIARVAAMHDLKAILQVAESDVHPVTIGMPVRIDTGNGIIMGQVMRIAPAAQNGTVAVDVTFRRPPPPGSRPDANVDGAIEIASVRNALSIVRPAGASDNSTIDLFKEIDNGKRAVRIRLRLGQGSSNRVQVLSGLEPGDVVIVSDMSGYLNQPEVTLN